MNMHANSSNCHIRLKTVSMCKRNFFFSTNVSMSCFSRSRRGRILDGPAEGDREAARAVLLVRVPVQLQQQRVRGKLTSCLFRDSNSEPFQKLSHCADILIYNLRRSLVTLGLATGVIAFCLMIHSEYSILR